MFRDTFAVELLNKGVPIDRVSLLLGHSSVKVTEKHYAPFVKERQQQLENYARMAWDETAMRVPPPKKRRGRGLFCLNRATKNQPRLVSQPQHNDATMLGPVNSVIAVLSSTSRFIGKISHKAVFLPITGSESKPAE